MIVKVCPFCRGIVVEKVGPEYLFDMYLGTFQFDLCLDCGERLYHEDIMDAIDNARDIATAFITNTSASSDTYFNITDAWTNEHWSNSSNGVD